MDISFSTAEGAFNFRVAAIIVNNGRLLIMRDEGIPHDYLPGGRVHLHETVEAALQRELREELDVSLPEHRPVFFAESFFDFRGMPHHELGVYHLMQAPAELLARGDAFTRIEGDEIHHFRWVPFGELAALDFFPLFLKDRINSLPESPEFLSCLPADQHPPA